MLHQPKRKVYIRIQLVDRMGHTEQLFQARTENAPTPHESSVEADKKRFFFGQIWAFRYRANGRRQGDSCVAHETRIAGQKRRSNHPLEPIRKVNDQPAEDDDFGVCPWCGGAIDVDWCWTCGYLVRVCVSRVTPDAWETITNIRYS